jgi:hypothetical protein
MASSQSDSYSRLFSSELDAYLGYSDACGCNNQLNQGFGVRVTPEISDEKDIAGETVIQQFFMNPIKSDSFHSLGNCPLRYLGLRPDCEGLHQRLRFRTYPVPLWSARLVLG